MLDQFSEAERQQAIELIERIPWGDADAQLNSFEASFRRAFEATAHALRLWEDSVSGYPGFSDEFELSPKDVSELSDEWRLAYVARHLENMRLVYGIFKEDVWDEEPESLANLLRGLNDLATLGFVRTYATDHDDPIPTTT